MAIIESASTDVLLEREEPLAQLHAALAGAARRAGAGSSSSAGRRASGRRRSFAGSAPSSRPGPRSSGEGAIRWRRRDRSGRSSRSPRRAGRIDGVLDPWSAPHDVAAGGARAPSRRQDARRRGRGRALGGRGHARRPAALRPEATPTTSSLVLVTYRDDELARDHPLRIALGDLSTAAAVERLAVRPLSRDGVAELAGCRNVDVDAVWRLTAGQPVLRRPSSSRTEPTRYPDTVRDLVLASGGAARPTGDGRGRGDGDRSALARRGAPPGGVRRGGRFRGRVPRERRPPCRATAASRSGTSSRARPWRSRSRRRGDSRCTGRCCWRSRTHPVRDADLARIAHHAEEAGRPERRAALRAGGGGAGGERRRVPRGGGPVRARAALRRRSRARGPRRAPRGSFPGAATSRTTRPRRSRSFARRSGAGRRRAPRWRRRVLSPSSPTTSGAAATTARRTRPSTAPRQLAAERPEQREHAYVLHTQALQALYRGDADAMLRARPPCARDRRALRRRGHRRACARHHRQRNGTPRPRARACA